MNCSRSHQPRVGGAVHPSGLAESIANPKARGRSVFLKEYIATISPKGRELQDPVSSRCETQPMVRTERARTKPVAKKRDDMLSMGVSGRCDVARTEGKLSPFVAL